MNSEVHPAVAALVIALSILAIALFMWAGGVAASYGGPAELKLDPRGHAYIQIQNYLVEHDDSGEYLTTHDVTEFDVDVFLGSFDFFSNGDILMRRGVDSRSFVDNARAYMRETNQNSISPESPNSGLYRCNLESKECERFGEPGIDFKAAYGVYIDRRSDVVYFSDTTRHLLRKYSADGTELAVTEPDFKFPNQLMLYDDELLVADTNNHVIRILERRSEAFAAIVDTKNVVPDVARNAEQRWPSHFARVGDTWWVNNMRTGMNDGGLYVFDRAWQFDRRIDMPDVADPIALAVVGGVVWVSDWNNDLVHRYSLAGERLSALESQGLEEILNVSRKARFQYEMFSYAGFAVVAIVFLVLIVWTLVNKPPNRGSGQAVVDENQRVREDEQLILKPDVKVRKRATLLMGAVWACMILAVASLFQLVSAAETQEIALKLAVPVAGMAALILLISWANNANWGTEIRIAGNTVTLVDHTGQQSSCPINQVRYDDTAIATRDAVVVLGRAQARVYEKTAITDLLLPRLTSAQRVGPFKMLKIQIDLRHPQGVFVVIATVGAAAVYLATQLFTG